MMLPLAASADKPARHLTPEQLIMLPPSPDVRPTYDANHRYVSGGIGILVYDGVSAMDALGPYTVFSTAGLKPMLISASKDAQGQYKTTFTTDNGIQMTAHRTIGNTDNLEVLVITGGILETARMAENTGVLNWIKTIDKNTVWTTSVCTGSWILGATGLLQGKKATSNWYRADELLAHFGSIPESEERYVFDGKIVTAAGVTAGIDMALALVKKLYANDLNKGKDFTQAVMLEMQYDPKPPIKGGSPEKTDQAVYESILWMFDAAGYWYGLGKTLGDYVNQIPIQ
jgi:transcriptional regulator GlxA family with amidase domain